REKWVVVERPDLAIIPVELWDAAQARITTSREKFLRNTKGKLLGHAENTRGTALLSGFIVCGAPARSERAHGGSICGEPMIASARGRSNQPVYCCRAVKAGKGPGYCDNTTAVPRDMLEKAIMASLRETFSAQSFREHQRRLAQDKELKASREAQRNN